jgi:hypothetical protein
MTASARIPVVSESARSHRRSRGDQRAEPHAPASSDGRGGQGSPRRRTPGGRGRRRLLDGAGAAACEADDITACAPRPIGRSTARATVRCSTDPPSPIAGGRRLRLPAGRALAGKQMSALRRAGHCERSEASSAMRPRRTSSPAHRVLSPVSDSKLEMPIGLGAAEEVRKNGAAVGSAQCAIILPVDANNSPCSAQKSSLFRTKKLPVNSANLTR